MTLQGPQVRRFDPVSKAASHSIVNFLKLELLLHGSDVDYFTQLTRLCNYDALRMCIFELSILNLSHFFAVLWHFSMISLLKELFISCNLLLEAGKWKSLVTVYSNRSRSLRSLNRMTSYNNGHEKLALRSLLLSFLQLDYLTWNRNDRYKVVFFE